jgi:hypothetical protein
MEDEKMGPKDIENERHLQLILEVFGRKQEPGDPPLESLPPSQRLVPDAPLTSEERAAVFVADCRFYGFQIVLLDGKSYHSGHHF